MQKKELGIFSEFGVTETREALYGRLEQGKQFAKRASWYDAIFSGFVSMSRDEGMGEYLIRLIMNVIINIFFGLVSASITFIYSAWGIIQSFQSSWLETIIFTICVLSVALSIIISFVGCVYVGGASLVVVASARNQALEGRQRASLRGHRE